MTVSLALPTNGGVFCGPAPTFSSQLPAPYFGWQSRSNQGARRLIYSTDGHVARHLLIIPNVTSGKRNSNKEVIMVDPLEAKRLAAEEMEKILARERLQRRRKIEAINGAWAMIGLTAGLLIEANTGKSIPDQLTGYWDAIVSVLVAGYWDAIVNIFVR